MIIRKCPFCRRELKNGSSHIYKCDKNTYKDNKVEQVKLDEFATILNVKNLVSDKVYLTQFEDESSPKMFPIALDRYSLTNFDIPIETHTSISRILNLLSFGVVFGNMYLWVCL